MPTIAQVKINTIQHTTALSGQGNQLNYVEVTGYDATSRKGFKKRFFATKQDGTATAAAEVADSLNKDDWAEFVMDDSSYKNVTMVKKIAQPAGMEAPSQGGGQQQQSGSSSANDGGGRMSKAEWAAKDARLELSIHRQSALKNAVVAMGSAAGKAPTKAFVVGLEKLAVRMTAFLQYGDFDADLSANVPAVPEQTPPANLDAPETSDAASRNPVGDDDIPF